MFNKYEFKGKVISNGYNLNEIAYLLGVNPTTLYRKINGESDFTRNEIELLRIKLSLSDIDVINIFFAEKLTET